MCLACCRLISPRRQALNRSVFQAPPLHGRRRRPSGRQIPLPAVRFAHETERLFAQLLDFYEVAWEYEPVEFVLSWHPNGTPSCGFRPDFYLPDHDVFVELTTLRQDLVTAKNNKLRRLGQLYPEVSVKILYRRDIVTLMEKHRLGATSTLAG